MQNDDAKLLVSLFLIPEDFRLKLATLAEQQKSTGIKSSINTLILQALKNYLDTGIKENIHPKLPDCALRAFTVRMPKSVKANLTLCAATWQVKMGIPVSMNAVVNTSISILLSQHFTDALPN